VNVCDTDLASLFNNAMLLMTGLAPLTSGTVIGACFIGLTYTKNDKKVKSLKGFIVQSATYGTLATLLFGLLTIASGLIPGGVACV
jgi:hypothetical protein